MEYILKMVKNMKEKKNNHKIKYKNPEDKAKIIKRLAIIEGQIRGISEMINQDKYCSDILIQIRSAEKALISLSNIILENHMRTCITDEIKKGNLSAVDEIMGIIKRNQ